MGNDRGVDSEDEQGDVAYEDAFWGYGAEIAARIADRCFHGSTRR